MRKIDIDTGIQMIEDGNDSYYEVTDGAIFSLDKYTPWYGELKIFSAGMVEPFAVPLDIDDKLMEHQDMVIPGINNSAECLEINQYNDLFFKPNQMGMWFNSVILGGCISPRKIKNAHIFVCDVMEHTSIFKQHIYSIDDDVMGIIFGKFVRDGNHWWNYICEPQLIRENYLNYILSNYS